MCLFQSKCACGVKMTKVAKTSIEALLLLKFYSRTNKNTTDNLFKSQFHNLINSKAFLSNENLVYYNCRVAIS
jgi:hypothetical protein